MSETYSDEQRDFVCTALIQRGRTIAAEIKSMDEDLKQIMERLDALTPVGWTLVVDGIKARKAPGNRGFDPELALARFSPQEIEACKAEGLDPKKIADLAKAKGIKEACMVSDPDKKPSVKLTP